MNERVEEEFYEAAAIEQFESYRIYNRRHLVLQQPSRQQRRVTRIGRQLTARTNQQHIDCFAQARELTLVVQDDSLNARTSSDKTQQPRFAAPRIRLNHQPCVDQRAGRSSSSFWPPTICPGRSGIAAYRHGLLAAFHETALGAVLLVARFWPRCAPGHPGVRAPPRADSCLAAFSS